MDLKLGLEHTGVLLCMVSAMDGSPCEVILAATCAALGRNHRGKQNVVLKPELNSYGTPEMYRLASESIGWSN